MMSIAMMRLSTMHIYIKHEQFYGSTWAMQSYNLKVNTKK